VRRAHRSGSLHQSVGTVRRRASGEAVHVARTFAHPTRGRELSVPGGLPGSCPWAGLRHRRPAGAAPVPRSNDASWKRPR